MFKNVALYTKSIFWSPCFQYMWLCLFHGNSSSKSTPKNFNNCTLSITLSFIFRVCRIRGRLSVWFGLCKRKNFVFLVSSKSLLDTNHWWTLLSSLFTGENNAFKFLCSKNKFVASASMVLSRLSRISGNSEDHLHRAKRVRASKWILMAIHKQDFRNSFLVAS